MTDRQKYAIELAADIMKKHINEHFNMALGNREAGVMVGYGEAINILSDMLLSDGKHTHDLKDNKNYYKWTNADRIRTMTDEELTEFIVGLNEHCLAGIGQCDCRANKTCENCNIETKEWLQSEAR